MKIQLLLVILTASIANSGLASTQPYNQMADQTVTLRVNDEKEIRDKFRNLFDSVARNDAKKRGTYRDALEHDAARERQAFDAMKEELRIAQHRNSYKKMHLYEASDMGRNIATTKRRERRQTYGVTTEIGKNTIIFLRETPYKPEDIDSAENEDSQTQVPAETLCQRALKLTKEVLDLENKFFIGVIQQFYRIREKNEIKWEDEFKNLMMDCQSIIDYDKDDIRTRLISIVRNDSPDLTTIPLRETSVFDLIHIFNQVVLIIEGDKNLKGVDEEIRTVRRLFDNAEAELHRYNYIIRGLMKRVAKRLSSTVSMSDNCTQTTPLTSI